MYNKRMSYIALYRKYRPKKFDQVVGQNHIVQTLQNVIKQNKIAHAYLFAGPRGTGKTSVAQIFANEINRSASGIDKNYELDIIEIDAASNNGIAEVRTIIENSKFAPTEGNFKVYIIDEVHMLTKGAWNALLKTLEEPPRHIVFILATTEPHRIPVTILSRTQRFNFKRIDNNVIYEQLIKTFDEEEIHYDQESLKFIAKLANGALRDALSISDQASAFGNGVISFEAISQVFGLVSITKQIEVLNAAFHNQSKKLMQTLSGFSDNGVDLERLTLSLIDILRDFIVYKKTVDLSLIVYLNIEDIEKIEISLDFAYQIIDEMIKLSAEIKWAELPRQLFELTILKISKFNEIKKQEFHDNDSQLIFTNNDFDPETIFNEVQKDPENLHVKLTNQQKSQNFNPKLHNLNFFNSAKLEVINNDDIFHTTLIDTNKFFDKKSFNEDELANTITSKLMTHSHNLINEKKSKKHQPQLDEKNDILPKSETKKDSKLKDFTQADQDKFDIIKLFGLDTKTSETKNNYNEQEMASQYSSEQLINLLLLANKDILTEAKDRWNILSAYINSNEYGEYAAILAVVKIITAGNNFLLVSSEDNEIIKTLNNVGEQFAFLKLLENILGKPTRVFAITREQFDEVKKTWNIMKAEKTLPKPQPISAIKIAKKQSDTEEFGLKIFGELFDK